MTRVLLLTTALAIGLAASAQAGGQVTRTDTGMIHEAGMTMLEAKETGKLNFRLSAKVSGHSPIAQDIFRKLAEEDDD